MNYNKIIKEKEAKILKLLLYGWGVNNIAAYLDVTYAVVYRVKRKNNIKKEKYDYFKDFYY